MPKFSFVVTSYLGFEDEILQLRNRNRLIPQNKEYLDWRYLGQEAKTPPVIFWVKTESGDFVGVASLISRPYWIDNNKHELMILGDISLDEKYRGTGLIDDFFFYINRHIKDKTSPCALVIPNAAAQKVLERSGWSRRERLIHHVLLLNPEKKIHSIVKLSFLSKIFSKCYTFILAARLRAIHAEGIVFRIITEFGEEFDVFWNEIDKRNTCRGDRSTKFLQWRYGRRPGDETFFIATGCLDGCLVAYLVYSINVEMRTSIVYELMATKEKYLKGLVKLFVNYLQVGSRTDSVRIILNQEHPYSSQLKKMGFSLRKGGQSILVLVPDHPEVALGACRWFLTAGDKDA